MFPFYSYAPQQPTANQSTHSEVSTFNVASLPASLSASPQHQRLSTLFQSINEQQAPQPTTLPIATATTFSPTNQTAQPATTTNGCEISYSPAHQAPFLSSGSLLDDFGDGAGGGGGGGDDGVGLLTCDNQTATLADQTTAATQLHRIRYNETNFSEFEQVWLIKSWQEILLRVTFVVPILLLGILGNLTIIYSICKFKKFRTKATNIFILNMAIADLLTTIVCPLAALFTNIYQFYVLGAFLCRLEGFVKITCLLLSAYSLILLSLDWLLSVVRPFRRPISIRQSWFTIATIWLVSILMASPLFFWRHLRQRQWRDLLEVWCCELIQYTKYYWLGITFFLIYLPTLIMTIVLVCILAQMDKFEAKLRRSRGADQQQQRQRQSTLTTTHPTRPPTTSNSIAPPTTATTSANFQPAQAIFSNSQTATTNSSQTTNLSHSQRPTASQFKSINMKYRRRIMKILFTYLLTSMLCWTPLQFTIIYRHFRTEPVPAFWFFELAFFAQLSASLSSAMNPIIFGFLSQPFRQIVTKSWMFRLLSKLRCDNNNGDKANQNNNNNNNNNNPIPMNLRNHHNQHANGVNEHHHHNHYYQHHHNHQQHQHRQPRHLATPNHHLHQAAASTRRNSPKRSSSQSRTTRDHFVQEEPKLTIETTANDLNDQIMSKHNQERIDRGATTTQTSKPHKSVSPATSSIHQMVQFKRVSFLDSVAITNHGGDRNSLIDKTRPMKAADDVATTQQKQAKKKSCHQQRQDVGLAGGRENAAYDETGDQQQKQQPEAADQQQQQQQNGSGNERENEIK